MFTPLFLKPEKCPNARNKLGSLCRVIPAPLALMVGVGCIRALAALNRAGYVNRFVTPYNFAVTNPPTRENILHGIIITDLSAALPWPLKPRVFVPFIGTYRYSSVRAHWGREQGPSDDIISVIFMVAEWLHGKLPWRSLGFDEDRICFIKTYFYKTKAFKKLPREIRGVYKYLLIFLPLAFASVLLIKHTSKYIRIASAERFTDCAEIRIWEIYRKMYEVACTTAIDFKWVIGEFGKALNKRDPNGEYQIPSWLLIEQTDE
ncbi:unnamed protein product [Gongylonema pulchrum]|uniref:Protein kinase domain-containing protein n=1 Tax=Gongylonema pulchrum TaxID=637853 RepID=A0A183E1N6_9BILA|nr:unnamed protein product [Gongylonema pulchrum]